jgi:DNA-binding MarR family transcriptional regulator
MSSGSWNDSSYNESLFILTMSEPQATASKPPRVGIAFLLSQAGAHAAARFTEGLNSSLSLQPYDAGILRMLGANSGLSQRALCDMFGIFPSRLVSLLDGLESKKLVERRDDPKDRRRFSLHLTKLGRKTLDAIGKITRALEADLFASLSAKERDQLHELLSRIVLQQRIAPGVHPAYRALGKKET